MGGVCCCDRESDRFDTEVGLITKKFGNRYGVLEQIGDGKYGEVYKCLDTVDHKIVVYESNNLSSDSHFASVWNSMAAGLKCFKNSHYNANIARCLEIHKSESSLDIIFECPGIDIKKFINNISNFSRKPHLIKMFLQHMLSGLAYCHKYGIYHQVLKPANFVVVMEGDTTQLKLINFGLFKHSEQDLSYMAPEIILFPALDHNNHYSKVADVWSIGCIFVELVKSSPLFSTTSDTPKDHLISIFSLVGLPTEETWPGITKYLRKFHLDGVTFEPKNLAEEFSLLGADGVDLLSKMLCLDPRRRITINHALTHKYLL